MCLSNAESLVCLSALSFDHSLFSLHVLVFLCRRCDILYTSRFTDNAPAVSYWLRRVVDDGERRDWTSPSCEGCWGLSPVESFIHEILDRARFKGA